VRFGKLRGKFRLRYLCGAITQFDVVASIASPDAQEAVVLGHVQFALLATVRYFVEILSFFL
jgi:hypothetical protein